jgi:hypothetical protein
MLRFERRVKETNKRDAIKSVPIRILKMNYPNVDGLETFEKLVPREDIVCYGKYPNGKNCEFCNYVSQCQKLIKLDKAIIDLGGLNREQALEEIKKLLP